MSDPILPLLAEKPGLTVRAIGKWVGLRSSSSVHYRLARLEAEGAIRRASCPGCGSPLWEVIEQMCDQDGSTGSGESP